MTDEQIRQRKETLTALFHDKTYVPMKLRELAVFLDIPREQRGELKEVLDMLVAEGKAGISRHGRYGRPELFSEFLTGIFSSNPKGFGFVAVSGREEDVFIPAVKTGGAMHGDRVQLIIEAEGRGRRAEGAVTKILERARQTVVGLYRKNQNYGFVSPDDRRLTKDIYIPSGKDLGAVTGHKVAVRITDYGDGNRKPEGVVTEILGHVNDPGVDILSVVRAYDLPDAYPKEVMEQAASMPRELTAEDTEGRLDLRALPTVTIDGEDAKDLDDAVTISKENEDHYTLGVHIADVSHYVREGTPLDKEAFRRGTSVYLTDRVIPMLPHRLSNGICSLNEGEDRLALSCIMEIDSRGAVLGHQIAETVIRVDRRMTYTAVDAIITDRDEAVMSQYGDFVEMFDLMKELSDLLRAKRGQRGSIDFDFPESKITLDAGGFPIEIKPYERTAATKIIEDFMLMANETVAEDYFWQEIPFLYRTHEEPDPEKMKKLAAFVGSFGYFLRISNGEVHPKEIQKLLAKIEGSPEEALLSRMTLRSMRQARYTTECFGHFGLAARYYTHFTSPIRRYPDLQIHRIIKENLHSGLSERRAAHYAKLLPEVAVQSSALERRADEAERETEKLKKCQYMSRHVGESFGGVISGVTGAGLFVELPNTVEGMARISSLEGDYYIFDETKMELSGERTGRRYRLGQKVTVQVIGADKLTRTVDFAIAPEAEPDPDGTA